MSIFSNPIDMNKRITFTIDGQFCQADEGQGLIEAAQENGVVIPTLCYFNTLPPLGTCRICTVMINGRSAAACTARVMEGMVVQVETEELRDTRKGILEMMFAEGNHFCPACAKSGNCEMQRWGYQMEMTTPRFPLLFEDHIIDYHPQCIVLEKNRCILCRRCVEEVKTDAGKSVFYFKDRGHETQIDLDEAAEAQLTPEQAAHAMAICPVGAIMVSGKIAGETPGQRKYDLSRRKPQMRGSAIPRVKKKKDRYLVATASLAGCFGCHMSMMDIDLGLFDLIDLVDFHKSPLTDIKEFQLHCDIGLIEGGCCTDENVEVLRSFREHCDWLVSVGECAIMGGIPAMRNTLPVASCLREAYLEGPTVSTEQEPTVPGDSDLPKMLDKVYPCHEVVQIDYFIPGCPPGPEHIWGVVNSMITGEPFALLYKDFKYD